ncbi:MAG: hypothetical protein IPF82_17050 [Blastocatellia bacterium]|nr:hypothetical protein [Blastocatellia bacterium]
MAAAERALAEATETFDEHSAERKRIADASPRIGPDTTAIEGRRVAVRELRFVVIAAGTIRSRIDARASERKPGGIGLATTGLVLLGVGLLAGIVLAATGRTVEAAVVAAALAATGGVLLWLARVERGRDDSAGRDADERELHSLEERITGQWAELGGRGVPTVGDLDRFERTLEVEARSAGEAERAMGRLGSADARLGEANRRRVKAEKALEAAVAAERRHLESWRQWREATRIPGDPAPQAFLGMFGQIDVIRDAIRDRADQIRQREEISRELEVARLFLGSIPVLAERVAGRPLDEQLVEVDRILREVDLRRDLERDRAGMERTVRTLANQTEEARQALAMAETERGRASDAAASTDARWMAWLAGAGLPAGLLPATARTALETVGRVVDDGLDRGAYSIGSRFGE